MDECDPTKANANANLGLKKRASFTSESKVVDMIGRLYGDICYQEKYLLDMVKVFEVTSQEEPILFDVF